MQNILVLLDLCNLKGPSTENIDLDNLITFLEKRYSKTKLKIIVYNKFNTLGEAKEFRQEYPDIELKYIVKSSLKGDPDLDIAIALDAVVFKEKYDMLILGTGDADFVPLLDLLEEKKMRVELLSNKKSYALILSKHAQAITFLPDSVFKGGHNEQTNSK